MHLALVTLGVGPVNPALRSSFPVLLLLPLVAATGVADDPQPPATGRDRLSEVLRVNGEVRAAYQHGPAWPKPFLYPVTRPGWSEEPLAAGLFIAVRNTPVEGADGVMIPAATPFAVTKVTGQGEETRLHAPDFGGSVAAADAVPKSALVVRTLRESPLPFERGNRQSYDHTHHRGVWLAVDSVRELNWWGDKHLIRTRIADSAVTADGDARLQVTNDWLDADANPTLMEQTTWSATGDWIEADTTLTNATSGPLAFDDTKEGFFAVRVPDDFRESAGGELRTTEDRRGEDAVWGMQSPWMTYAGPDGTPFELTLADDPRNFRSSRYHARGYGLFTISPFGPHTYSRGKEPSDPLTLSPGESVRLRYGLWIHPPTDDATTSATVKEFVQRGETRTP